MDSPFKVAIEVGACLLLLAVSVHGYIKIRGENFGSWDVIVFGICGLVADSILYKFLGGYHPISDGYRNLGILMLFLLLIPIASFCNSVFLAAIFWNFLRNRAVAAYLAVLIVSLFTFFFLSQFFSADPSQKQEILAVPEASQTSSRTEGEDWALANDPTAEQCHKKSPNKYFLDGCMKHAQVKK